MRPVIWIVAALLLLPWTAATWAAAWLVDWSVALTASGGTVDPAAMLGKIDFPAWVTWWIDPAWLSAALEALVLALESLQAGLPWLSSVAGWLVALLWIGWALGALLVVGIAWLASWAVGRASHRGPVPA